MTYLAPEQIDSEAAILYNMMAKHKKILKLDGAQGPEISEQESTKPKLKQPGVYFLAQTSEIGFSIAVPISLGALFGVWMDKKFYSHPKFTLSFLLAGIFFAFFSLFYVVRTFTKKKE